ESIDDAARLVLGMGGEVEALSPSGLRSKIAALATAAARTHRRAPGSKPGRAARNGVRPDADL
ncbi:MAG: hypothetical protein K2Q06_07440, partial [Parvularculaceae bacterium]|nr:hypothetical protein [Parvularculaceae bacterium]